MELLEIKDFLVIEKARFDVGNINIIVGSQTSGKDILIKLLYFFREVNNDILLDSIKNNISKSEYISKIEELFKRYFPKYRWKNKVFDIKYIYDDIIINISQTKLKQYIQIDIGDKLAFLHRTLKTKYKSCLKKDGNKLIDEFWDFKQKNIFSDIEISKYFNNSIFIPEKRDCFKILEKNKDAELFINKFISKYDMAKKIYSDNTIYNYKFKNDLDYKEIKQIVEKILNGKYRYKAEQDWIEIDGELINLSDISLGQQGLLAMLLVLAISPFIDSGNNQSLFFVEEPELHLCSDSIKNMVLLIGLLYKKGQNGVITTHSQDIVTALNSLISKSIVDFTDIKAYTIKNKELVSILDKDEKLIKKG